MDPSIAPCDPPTPCRHIDYTHQVLHCAFLQLCEESGVIPKGLRVRRKIPQVPDSWVLASSWDSAFEMLEKTLLVQTISHYKGLCAGRSRVEQKLFRNWDRSPIFQQKSNKLSYLTNLHPNDCSSRLRIMTLGLQKQFACKRNPRRRLRRGCTRRKVQVVPEELERGFVNLSPLELSEDQKLALYRGLNFAIEPAEFDRKGLLEGCYRLKQRVLRAAEGHRTQALAFSQEMSNEIQQIVVKRSQSNLSKSEKACLEVLRNDDSIVIKPADKGRAVVVWDRDMYVQEISRQLEDFDTYWRFPFDQTSINEVVLAFQLDGMVEDGLLTAEVAASLKPKNSRTPPMYGLPKIHKLKPPILYNTEMTCKAKPIISACGCPTEKISSYVDSFIQPLARAVPSYLKDTTHFLQMLSKFQKLPEGTLLVTADVASLYPSIPTPDGLAALRGALDRRERLVPPTEALVRLAEMVLLYNHFTFNGEFYTQISGTAMGTKFAPSYAIIFMHEFESRLLSSAPLKPLCWFRYIDDIFILWTHGIDALQVFIDHCNTQNPSIKLTFDHGLNDISFLDVSVSIRNNLLHTDLYRKPTDTLHYLDFESCHPLEQKLPITYSQALRIRKICSSKSDAEIHCRELHQALIRCGYPRKECSKRIKRALNADRETLLWPVYGPNNRDPVRMIIPFHPDLQEVTNIVRKHSAMLTGISLPVQLFWKPPQGIKSRLVSSKLRVPGTFSAGHTVSNQQRGMTRCGRGRCLTCPMFLEGSTITSSKTGLTYKLPSATCTDRFVVYVLSFTNCDLQYVGQTSQKLSERMNLYRSTFRNKKTEHPFVEHMVQHEHAWEDLRVAIIQKSDTDNLSSCELHWISQLMTDVPFGLNVQNVLYRNVYKA